MGYTLAIDTSSYVLTVAVTEDSKVLGEMTTNIKKNHSLRLMPAIEQLMRDTGIIPEQLTKVVVADGPGSYTGVRIAVTTAKTLAWSLNIPLVGVSSLELMVQNGRFFEGHTVPIVDARRGQVFTALYRGEQHKMTVQKEDRLRMLNEWLEELKEIEGLILFVGQDVELHQEDIQSALGDKAVFAPAQMTLPRGGELAALGEEKEAVASIHTFVPRYLRLAEAEAKWQSEQKKACESND
ncbi:tRNA (adenosine(37)-N6)-threonylcarbamoyltransferase complex dimerization subunit type 1 TsaB [Alkalihalophilus marmarensis]|uniref:tRNA (adenosine(37)-N6)-threonylcarbamoyltransferase complex dimerization subunit type 1 TsaB n=1 Tax=Alkalihalophilus marmarensis TaxID=521377 RepID=UPI002DBC717C|nr:tRNA (adenosine(37)-N6)-threonylcarbamoyltransferase complex dimerization subunit type 1 TsaB [Alkalihalophilus marmarensis]MEC2071079.1 tRNA (adenosine(37)-N6)-threonylcarbamoyltransferase complex dimerization subunit type 1 TsaB [Alkalihalophilus marmarensis]